MTKYVAYYRVSTERQGRTGLGLEAQRQAVEAFIGGEPAHEFTEVESGKHNDRPELARAMDLAELIGATLIVAKLDRLSRDAEFLLKMQRAGVPILFADMPQADKLVIGVMAMLAEWEREQISKRTKAALKVAKERGRNVGGDRGNLSEVRATGTANSAKRRTETARARARKVAPHIAEAKAAGHVSTRAIASYLNAKGIRTVRGSEWRAGSVARVMAADTIEGLAATR